ncbi:MAG: SDR family oxidoreductase [Candidatus Saccharimonadales bacterium]
MKLVVFGAQGRTGRQVVFQALAAGHEVTAFIRSDRHILKPHARLAIVLGDASDPVVVAQAIKGQQAVISIIAPKLYDSKNYEISEIAMRNIVHAMSAHAIRRLIIQSGAWGTEHRNDAHPLARLLFRSRLREIYDFKINEDHIVRASKLDWTIVRCGLLTPQSLCKRIHIDMDRHKTKWFEIPHISRKSVAYFMLAILSDPHYYNSCPIILKG